MTMRVCGSNGAHLWGGAGRPTEPWLRWLLLGGVAPALVFAALVAAMHATHRLMLFGFFFWESVKLSAASHFPAPPR